jgi:hypothetical protein
MEGLSTGEISEEFDPEVPDFLCLGTPAQRPECSQQRAMSASGLP